MHQDDEERSWLRLYAEAFLFGVGMGGFYYYFTHSNTKIAPVSFLMGTAVGLAIQAIIKRLRKRKGELSATSDEDDDVFGDLFHLPPFVQHLFLLSMTLLDISFIVTAIAGWSTGQTVLSFIFG